MPQSEDKFISILEKLSEIGERTARIEVEQKNMKEDLEEVKKQDSIQNSLLAEHIRGVETQALRLDNEIEIRKSIEAQTVSLENRVEKLEIPTKFKDTLKQYILTIGGIATAIVGMIKLLKYSGLL